MELIPAKITVMLLKLLNYYMRAHPDRLCLLTIDKQKQ
jgi:hypothetical protein